MIIYLNSKGITYQSVQADANHRILPTQDMNKTNIEPVEC